MTELQAQLASEQQNFERQRTVTQQLDGQLQDALRELKVSMIEQWHAYLLTYNNGEAKAVFLVISRFLPRDAL